MSSVLKDFSPAIRDMLTQKHASSSVILKMLTKFRKTRNKKIKEEMRDAIVSNNSRLVLSICIKSRRTYDADIRDMFQWGVIGVITAMHKFDLKSRNKFSTYAVFWIKHMINQGMAKESMITVPRDFYYTYSKISHILGVSENGKNKKELKKAIKEKNIKAEDFNDLVDSTSRYNNLSNHVYLDKKVKVKGELVRENLSTLLRDENAKNPEVEAERKDLIEKIKLLIDKYLIPEEQEVIKAMFFSDKNDIKYVAKKVGLTYKETIYHRDRAIKKLKSKIGGLVR